MYMSIPAISSYCSDDPTLAHATVSGDIERTIGSSVDMRCLNGYAVEPKETALMMECKADTTAKGKWEGNGECKSI